MTGASAPVGVSSASEPLYLVQHDPRRADLLRALLADLPVNTEVVADPGAHLPQRSPWRCYQACLERALENGASHTVIVQDDVQVCLDFGATVEKVIAARPDDPICIFTPGIGEHSRRILDACYHSRHWALLDPQLWTPVVCLIWPRPIVERLLVWAEQKQFPPSRFGDDSIIGEFCREEKVSVWATCPSLVEHPDMVRSLVGTAAFGGRNPGRCAACWVGREWSPLAVDWRV